MTDSMWTEVDENPAHEAAIKWAEGEPQVHHNAAMFSLMLAFQAGAAWMAARADDGWVSVEDRMPGDAEVLAWSSAGAVVMEVDDAGTWFAVNDNAEIVAYDYDVTHWRPLPPPPAKKEEGEK